jgi:L-lactate dehydrogenase complex protein LldG
MAGRKEMLERIRKALRHPLDSPAPAPQVDQLPPLAPVLAPVPRERWLDAFEAELRQVGGLTYRAASLSELESILRGILDSAQAKGVVLSRNPLLATLNLHATLAAWGYSVDVWPSAGQPTDPERERTYREACFAAQVGITGADWALVETGSLVLSSAREGSQLASLAPPVHVVLYRRPQIVETLDQVIAKLGEGWRADGTAPGRSVVFITGTSRTADIEQILVRGVHGPGELHAVLVEERCCGELPPHP